MTRSDTKPSANVDNAAPAEPKAVGFERVRQLAAERAAALEQEDSATVYQLALWKEEHKRAMPIDFIRSALFAAIQAKDATYLQRAQIASANGYTIVYTGRRLTQVHADVWEGIMYLAGSANKSEKEYVAFTAGQLLRLIGRGTGRSQHQQLRRMIADLTATSVEIIDMRNKRRFWGSLLPKGGDQETDTDTQYAVFLNRDIVKLFARYATIDFRQRQRLLKKPLALWLQHFFSDEQKPVTVEFLQTHSGSLTRNIRHFRAQLRRALNDLVTAGVLRDWQIDSKDVVRPVAPVEQPTSEVSAKQVQDDSAPRQRLEGGLPTMNDLVGAAVGVAIGEKARAEFRRTYPSLDLEECLAAWNAWPKSREAKYPSAMFRSFAKTWAADQQ